MKDNPWLIATDPVFQVAIRKLQTQCSLGTSKEVNKAGSLLEKAGIPVFTPKGIPKRITDNPTLRWWQENPYFLIDKVKLYEKIIETFKSKSYYTRDDTRNGLRKGDIAKAFQHIFKEQMPKDLIFGERDRTPKIIALAFISHEYQLKFEALRKHYNNISKKLKNLPKA